MATLVFDIETTALPLEDFDEAQQEYLFREADKLVEAAEVTSISGSLPVNPSGGLKSKGHPPGATEIAQCVELFEQLRGDACNEVDGPRIALAHNIGAPTAVSA